MVTTHLLFFFWGEAEATAVAGRPRPSYQTFILPDGTRYYGTRREAKERALNQFRRKRKKDPVPEVEFVPDALPMEAGPFIPTSLRIVELPAFEARPVPGLPAPRFDMEVVPLAMEAHDEEEAIIAILLGG